MKNHRFGVGLAIIIGFSLGAYLPANKITYIFFSLLRGFK
jgi:hypothetical protein